MRAIVYDRYGPPDVLEEREIDEPAVGDDEVLVRVRASSVNVADYYFLTGRPWLIRLMGGLTRPKRRVLGRDVAGTVERVGAKVTGFRPGDEVFGECEGGAFAEYVAVAEDRIVTKPADLSFEEAAAVPLAGTTALRGLRDTAKVGEGKHVLINGASGAVGTFAVQVGKALGAEVTAVCSTRNLEMVRSLGADHASDYTKEDFTRGDRRYDAIVDLVGSRPLSACLGVLTPGGIYVSSVGRMGWLFKVLLNSAFRRRKVTMLPPNPSKEQLLALRELLEAGKVRPVVHRTFPLAEVGEALRRQGEGHARGKTVITV